MQDYKLEQDNSGCFDLVQNGAVLETVEGFQTAIDYQLFTDRRASKNEVTKARERQGWIGDVLTKQEGYEGGSFIYLKNQARNTPDQNLQRTEFANDSLNYFTSSGIAQSVTSQSVGQNIEGVIVAESDEVARFSRLWRVTNAAIN